MKVPASHALVLTCRDYLLQVSQGWLFPMAAAFCFLERVREPGNMALSLILHASSQWSIANCHACVWPSLYSQQVCPQLT